MVGHPITVRRDYYSGRVEQRRRRARDDNNLARLLEAHVNAQLARVTEWPHLCLYDEIAHDTGVDAETVRRLMFSVDCGHNGFTVYGPRRGASERDRHDD